MATMMIWGAASNRTAPASGRFRLTGRLLGAVAFIMIGLATVIRAPLVRAGEATLAASLVGITTGTQTYVWPSRGSFYWGMGSGEARGLRISAECSMAYVGGPLLVAFGFLLLLERLPPHDVVIGALAGVAVMLAVNTVRIVLIAESVHFWDSSAALWWSHIVLGSIIAVIGNVVALALALRIAFRNGRGAP